MTWVILIIVAGIIIAVASGKKQTNETTTNEVNEVGKSLHSEVQQGLLKLVGFGVDALTSTEMTPSEKQSLITDVCKSIFEHAGTTNANKYIRQIAVESYKKSILEFKEYDSDILDSMQLELDDIINGGAVDDSTWDNLIDYSTNYREALQHQIKLVEDEIKRRENPDNEDVQVKVTSYSTGDDGHLSFSVAGTKFRTSEEIERIMELEYAEELKLEPEPTNPYDSDAIAIYTSDDSLIGYVPKEMTKLMRDDSDNLKQYRCVFTKRTEHTPPFVNVRVDFI